MPSPLSKADLLNLMPQVQPFRFVDQILEVDESHIVASYHFGEGESFYQGHFPGHPITPGVILLESMAQSGLVLQGMYLLSLELPVDEVPRYRALFTNAAVEWCASIYPGDTTVTKGEVMSWRRYRIRSRIEMRNQRQKLIAYGEIAAMEVRL